MKALFPLLLLAACQASPPPPESAPARPEAPPAARAAEGSAPPALQVTGVPPLPREVSQRLLQYQSVRGAIFEDWGPDGSVLVATRFAETVQVHRVPFPGGRREQLTFSEEPVSEARWMPGSREILYSQGQGGNENYQVTRLDPSKGHTTLLTDGRSRNGMGPISHSGDRMILSSTRRNGRDTDLYLLDLGSGAAQMILEARGEFWVATDWSPDDARLALLRVVSVNESTPAVMDLGSRTRREIPLPGGGKAGCGSPRFARKGRELWFPCDAGGEFRQIHAVDLETGDRSVRTQAPWDVEDLVTQGDQAAFLTNEDGVSKLHLSGTDPVALPMGVLTGLSFSPDGKRLGFTLSRPDQPSDVYTYEIAESKLVRWTYSETGGLDPASFVLPDRISFPSFDGRPIPAFLYRPRGGSPAPVVISIHGGPESQFRPTFSSLIQYWVNELGLAVLAPNVRGSTGYGNTYVALDNAEKREDAVRDIGGLLDWIGSQKDLDPARVAVHGGSYGGFMVLASLVRYPDRLRAGVDIVGIANFITFLEKTSGYRVDLRRAEYGDERDPKMRAFFERISPAFHADKIRSALLVAHGRNDPRVPFSEADQIASRVRALGRPVWTVYADNEGHGFARKENRDYLTAATTLFFREHLLK